MNIIFEVETKDKVAYAKILLVTNDCVGSSTKSIINAIMSFASEETKESKTLINLSYDGTYKENFLSKNYSFDALIRTNKGIPEKVICLDDGYTIYRIRDVLNQEIKEDGISYEIYNIKGSFE